MWFVLPGIASSFPPSAGIHQLWSTSAERMVSFIARHHPLGIVPTAILFGGLKAASDTLQSRHGLPGIALSGYGMDEDVRQSREAGFSLHLTKPVNLGALQEAIRRVWPQAATRLPI